MHILVYTAMNKRHMISRVFAAGMWRFMQAAPNGITMSVLAVISEDESIDVCKEYGFGYVKALNEPLGRKWNAGLTHALTMDWDYLMIMGDDDVIADEAWPLILPKLQERNVYFGFRNIYFMNPVKQKALLFDYSREPRPDNRLIGCGRFIARSCVVRSAMMTTVEFLKNYVAGVMTFEKRQVVDMPCYQATYIAKNGGCKIIGPERVLFWGDTLTMGLDNYSEHNLLMNGVDATVLYTKYPLMTDVKSDKNIWEIDRLPGRTAEVSHAMAFMGHKERVLIETLMG